MPGLRPGERDPRQRGTAAHQRHDQRLDRPAGARRPDCLRERRTLAGVERPSLLDGQGRYGFVDVDGHLLDRVLVQDALGAEDVDGPHRLLPSVLSVPDGSEPRGSRIIPGIGVPLSTYASAAAARRRLTSESGRTDAVTNS